MRPLNTSEWREDMLFPERYQDITRMKNQKIKPRTFKRVRFLKQSEGIWEIWLESSLSSKKKIIKKEKRRMEGTKVSKRGKEGGFNSCKSVWIKVLKNKYKQLRDRRGEEKKEFYFS